MEGDAKKVRQAVMALSALFFGFGFITVVVWLTWICLPWELAGRAYALSWLWFQVGLTAMIVSAGLLYLGLPGLETIPNNAPEPKRSSDLYARYLVGVSFFLLIGALETLVALAGFAYARILHRIAPLGNDISGGAGAAGAQGEGGWLDLLLEFLQSFTGIGANERIVTTSILMLSLGMALLGALFFFAKAMWDKLDAVRQPNPNPSLYFNEPIFWAGLWFRLGEAVLFTIGMFLLLRFMGKEAVKYLPVLALLLGFSVRAGEAFFATVADRILGIIQGLMFGSASARPPNPQQQNPPHR